MISKSKNFDAMLEALGELTERSRAYSRQVLSVLGTEVLAEAKKKLKPKFWWQPKYKSSLRVGYIAGSTADMLAVYGDAPSTVRHLNVSRMLIWFGAPGNKRLMPRADLFRKYSPWTVDTLPNVAGGLFGAKALIRNVAPGVVLKRRKALRKLLPGILKELASMRVPVLKKGAPKLQNRSSFDLEYSLLAQEFFRGGRPVWRPIIRDLPRLINRSVAAVPTDAFLDPKAAVPTNDGFGETEALDPALLSSIGAFQGKLIGKKVRE